MLLYLFKSTATISLFFEILPLDICLRFEIEPSLISSLLKGKLFNLRPLRPNQEATPAA